MNKQSKSPGSGGSKSRKAVGVFAAGAGGRFQSIALPARADGAASTRRGAARHGFYPHTSNILENEELLSISHSSRVEDSNAGGGVHTLSINLVRNELQAMVETQRSQYDEQGQVHSASSGTTKEVVHSPQPAALDSRYGTCVGDAPKLPIDVRSLKDRELRALIAHASKELKTRMSSDDPLCKEPRRRSSSHVNRGLASASRSAQDGSCYDFHNYEIDDPEVRSFDSRERSSVTQERRYPSRSRSGAVAPIRCTDSNDRKTDEIRYIFTPLSPPRSSATTPVNTGSSAKKNPKHVPPLKKPSNVVIVDCGDSAPPRGPTFEFMISPRSAFDDCSVNSSLSESTAATGGKYFTH